jgi:nicotinate-nucleotide adenylyltransferase
VSVHRASGSAQAPRAVELGSLGVLGGTFNPPHLGHLALARHAQRQLGLERVLLVPAHTSPGKAGGGHDAHDPGPEQRLQMCRLAVADAEAALPGEPSTPARSRPGGDGGLAGARVCVCAVEIERGGVSYTVDTLSALHDRHPHAQLTLIVGADVARTLGSWREPARVLELAGVAVAERPGTQRGGVLEALAELGDPSAGAGRARVSFVEMPAVEISSSLVRERAARGEPIEQLVGGPVASYIAEHRLYRPEGD